MAGAAVACIFALYPALVVHYLLFIVRQLPAFILISVIQVVANGGQRFLQHSAAYGIFLIHLRHCLFYRVYYISFLRFNTRLF